MSLYYIDGGGGKGRGGGNPTVVTDADNTNLEVAGGTAYKFTSPLSVLKIKSVATSDKESIIYFTTDSSSISFTDDSNVRWGGGNYKPSLELNTVYCIAIRNGLAEIDNFGTVS